jgi:hypothetical protein
MLIPAAPKGLKPGEVSMVLLGRVVAGDVAVTLVDLAQRVAPSRLGEAVLIWSGAVVPS